MSKLKQTLFSLKDADRKIIEEKLKEKDREIEQLKQEKKNIGEEKSTREFLETLSKDQVVELCLQYLIDVEITEKQPAEKDKEIERLKDFIGCKGCVDVIKKSNEDQKQLAIQELEKVKVNLKDRISMMKNKEHSYLQKVVAWYAICDQINQQIKELKGENK